jgi:hypothetical protein
LIAEHGNSLTARALGWRRDQTARPFSSRRRRDALLLPVGMAVTFRHLSSFPMSVPAALAVRTESYAMNIALIAMSGIRH